jgi:hypothetical protein
VPLLSVLSIKKVCYNTSYNLQFLLIKINNSYRVEEGRISLAGINFANPDMMYDNGCTVIVFLLVSNLQGKKHGTPIYA